VKYLLDTHVLLWWADSAKPLSPAAVEAIGRTSHQVFVSMASFWEMAIKESLGKLNVPFSPDEVRMRYGFTLLPITSGHIDTLKTLPHFRQHRDPFDRMLIAQALAEGLAIVTRDPQFRNYGAPLVPA